MVAAITSTKDSYAEVYYPMHRCTDDDFENFFPTEKASKLIIEKYKEENNLFCYDREALAEFEMNGTWRTDAEYRSLDFRMIPCAVQYTAFDGTVHGGDESCVWDKEEVLGWLGGVMDVMVLHNQPIFNQDEYSKGRVQNTS